MTDFSDRYPNLSDKMKLVLRDHNISRAEAEAIVEDVGQKLKGNGRKKRARLSMPASSTPFFQKPMKRRLQILAEAFLTSLVASILVAIFVAKLIN